MLTKGSRHGTCGKQSAWTPAESGTNHVKLPTDYKEPYYHLITDPRRSHMKRVLLNMTMTFDGFFCGPNGELDWMSRVPDKQLNDDTVAFFDQVDSGFIGYPTGVGMIAYWANVASNPSASEAEHAIAKAVNKLHPILVSNRDEKPPSDQIELLVAKTDDQLVAAVAKIRQRPGKDVALSGGIRTVQTFVRLGLIDQYVITVHPVAIGNGKRVFSERTNLELTDIQRYKSGVVRLCFLPGKAQ